MSLISTLLFCAANILANGDFEALVGKDVAAWNLPRKPVTYQVKDGVGRNGSRGLLWDDSNGGAYVMARNRIDIKPGISYRFGGWIKAERLGTPRSCVALYFDCYSKDGKWLEGCSSSFAAKEGDWIQVSGRTCNMPEETAYGVLMAYAAKGSKGRAVFDDLYVEPLKQELLGEIYTSAYRNAAVDGRVKLFIEVNSCAPEAKSPGIKMAFRLPKQLMDWRELDTVVKDGYATAEVDVSELRFGKSPIQFWVTDNGKYVTSKVIYFERFKGNDPRKVYFDSKNRAIVNGKPFFPMGMYASELTEDDVRLLAKGGFNCAMPYRGFRLTEKVLDVCSQSGLMVMPNIKDYLYGERHSWEAIKDAQTGDAVTAEQISRFKDHPAILAWYSCDESEASAVPRLRERQKLIEQLDPDHPTWIVLYQAPYIRRYMGAFDVIGTDPYPIADLGQYPKRKDGIKRVTNWTRQTYEGVYDGIRPMWQVPQCFDWAIIKNTEAERLAAPSRPPTYEEVYNMAWQCIVGGANGLVFYSLHDLRRMEKRTPFQQSFGIVSRVAKNIRMFEKVFLEGSSRALETGNDDVVARMWTHGESRLIAVINASVKPQTATVRGKKHALKPLEVSIFQEMYTNKVDTNRKPLFKAGLITDTHVAQTKESCRHVKAAWELFAKAKVDLVANIGDIADHHYPSGYKAYRETVDEVISANAGWNPKELYVYAWHDAYDYNGDLNRSVPKAKEAFADTRKYLRANDTFAEIELGDSPVLVFPQMLQADGYARYERMVKSAVERYPGRPVFVLDHVPPRGTVGGGSGDAERRRILNRYPSVIAISGHIHGTLQSKRHIWQGEFTAVNCGCMHRWGGSMVGHSVPSRSSYNAIIMEVYKDYVLFRRYPNVFTPEEFEADDPWRVDLPYSKESARYTPQKQAANEKPAAFPKDAKLSLKVIGNPMKALAVSFPAAMEAPNRYKIEAFVKDKIGKRVRVLRRDVLGDYDVLESMRPKTVSLEISALYFDPCVEYEFNVTPCGFFDAEGTKLSATVAMPQRFADMGGRKIYEVKGASEQLPVLAGWNGVKPISTCDSNGVYRCNGGIVRLHLPDSLWNVPKGTKFRCELDFRIVGAEKKSFHVGLACPRPLRYLGRALTPPGDTGDVRSVIEFSKEQDSQFFDVCIEGLNPCTFELKRLSVFRY